MRHRPGELEERRRPVGQRGLRRELKMDVAVSEGSSVCLRGSNMFSVYISPQHFSRNRNIVFF